MESAEKIKVMHIVTRMNVGGVAVLIDNLLSNIDSEQFEVLLVTGACEHPESDYLDQKQVPYKVKKIDNFQKSFSLKNDLSAAFQIRKIMKIFKPDIVHSHTSKAGLFGRVEALLFLPKAKRIHTFHGHLLVGYFKPINIAIIKFIESFLALISTKLIAMGTQVKNDLVKARIAPDSKFKVFFPGIAKPSLLSREEARHRLGLDSDSIYCIFIGRLTQVKRPDRVIDIAKKLKKLQSNIRIIMVGEGELYSELMETTKKEKLNVDFLGWRSDVDVLLAASNMLLLTSDNEAVALTLIEASLSGIPIVTTSAGSVRDVAIDGFNGFVTGFDVQDLTKAILTLAESSEIREEMGANGAFRANQLFTIAKMVDEHQQLYKELLRF